MIGVLFKSALSAGGLPLLYFAGAILIYGSGYLKGSSDRDDTAKIERLEKEKSDLSQDKKRLEAQVKVARDAVDAASQQSDEDEKQIEKLKDKVNEFKNGLGKKDKRFILDAHDVRRLLNK